MRGTLYGSIPFDDADGVLGLFSVMSVFYQDWQDASDFLMDIPVNDFMDLFRLCLFSDTIIYKEKSYLQKSGLTMGNPIAPQAAVIFMNYVEQKILSSQSDEIHWKRYIDDIFIIYPSHVNIENLLSCANGTHASINFTMELPNLEGFLPFLDCELKLHDGHFSSRIYSKHFHSNTIHPWCSHSPISLKRGIVLGEIRRAMYRSTKDCVSYSIKKVFQRFADNGYPRSFLDLSLIHI